METRYKWGKKYPGYRSPHAMWALNYYGVKLTDFINPPYDMPVTTNVYLVQSSNGGAVKIGQSDNPRRRLYQLRVQYKDRTLRMIATIKSHWALECWLHIRFEDYPSRPGNEWFYPIQEIADLIHRDSRWKIENELIVFVPFFCD